MNTERSEYTANLALSVQGHAWVAEEQNWPHAIRRFETETEARAYADEMEAYGDCSFEVYEDDETECVPYAGRLS